VVTQLTGAFEIVDCTDQFPQLKRSPGLVEWPFFGPDLVLIETPDGEKFLQTLFPFGSSESLRFCMRFYRQDLDSGGFFVAVLRKVAQFERVSREPGGHQKEFCEPPFKPIDADAESEIRRTFGLTPAFKSDQLFFRGDQKVNSVYYFESALAAKILRSVPHSRLRPIADGVKVFNFKRFQKDEGELPCPAQEGVKVIAPSLTKLKFTQTPEEMKRFLE
jgi:hypothetical protein